MPSPVIWAPIHKSTCTSWSTANWAVRYQVANNARSLLLIVLSLRIEGCKAHDWRQFCGLLVCGFYSRLCLFHMGFAVICTHIMFPQMIMRQKSKSMLRRRRMKMTVTATVTQLSQKSALCQVISPHVSNLPPAMCLVCSGSSELGKFPFRIVPLPSWERPHNDNKQATVLTVR